MPPLSVLSLGICNVLFALPLSGKAVFGSSGVLRVGVGSNFSGIGSVTTGTDTASGDFSATTGSSLIFFLSLPVQQLHPVLSVDPVKAQRVHGPFS
jgi:hypothetical protein